MAALSAAQACGRCADIEAFEDAQDARIAEDRLRTWGEEGTVRWEDIRWGDIG